MDPVALFLLAIAGIFLVGILGEVVFEKTNVPDVVWLIAVGILLGPLTGLAEKPLLQAVAPYFGALTLVIVLFEGGHSLRLRELSQSAVRGSTLAILAFTFSCLTVAGVSMLAARFELLPEEWTLLHGLTLGSILGGTSAVVIMPAMAKANLSLRLSNLLCLESAVTDVLCVVATVACIEVAVSGATDFSSSLVTLGRSFGVGLGAGLVLGMVGLLFLRLILRSEYAYPFTLSYLLIVYVVVDAMKGSAALSVLTVAVMLGNANTFHGFFGLSGDARLSKGVTSVHHQISFIIKSFFFAFIGAMLSPPWALLGLGVLFGIVLLPARLPAVLGATYKMEMSRPARALATATMPRGMAAGVLAMMPAYAGMAGTEELPVIVFATVFTTILVFAIGFPLTKRRLWPSDLLETNGRGLEDAPKLATSGLSSPSLTVPEIERPADSLSGSHATLGAADGPEPEPEPEPAPEPEAASSDPERALPPG